MAGLQSEHLDSLSSDFLSAIDADQFAYLSDEVIGQLDAEMTLPFHLMLCRASMLMIY